MGVQLGQSLYQLNNMAITPRDQSLNKYGLPNSSLLANPQQYNAATNFEMQNEVSQRYMRTSSVNIRNFVINSNIAYYYPTPLNNGDHINFISTLDFQSPHQNDPNFAICYAAIYQGSEPNNGIFHGSTQIYPNKGAGVTAGAWTNVMSSNDFHSFDGTVSTFVVGITNNTGSTIQTSFITQWKYLRFNVGTT